MNRNYRVKYSLCSVTTIFESYAIDLIRGLLPDILFIYLGGYFYLLTIARPMVRVTFMKVKLFRQCSHLLSIHDNNLHMKRYEGCDHPFCETLAE